jgi:hypothetical protein
MCRCAIHNDASPPRAPTGPLHRLGVLQGKAGPIGPMARPLGTQSTLAPLGPPSHSIISSALSRIEDGTSRPSDFAVLRLTTRSYLVGACTGRSPGFSPRRMRST